MYSEQEGVRRCVVEVVRALFPKEAFGSEDNLRRVAEKAGEVRKGRQLLHNLSPLLTFISKVVNASPPFTFRSSLFALRSSSASSSRSGTRRT